MSKPPFALSVEALSVDLPTANGPRALLRDISFDLPRHGLLGVVGASGSGKSVLARALCNWVEPPLRARGAVRFDGVDILDRPPAAMRGLWGRRIAYIGADPTTCFDPTVRIGAQIVEKLRSVEPGIGRDEATRRVIKLLDEVRIPDAAARFHDLPHRFSGGMIQRAAIVDALITDPELLVADSITQPLDVTVAAQIIGLLRALHARFHSAIVFISSSLAVVRELADEVLVLSDGAVVERGTARRLIEAPEHAATRRMLALTPRVWADAARPTEPPASDQAFTPRVETALAEMAPLLAVESLRKHYELPGGLFRKRAVQAVRGLSFEVRRGETFGIVGESGCGKSTLSRLLTGLEAPDAGRIVFEGHDIAGLAGAHRLALCGKLQLVLPDPFQSLPAHQSIGRIVAEPLRVHRRLEASRERELVLAAMAEVGLPAQWFERLPGGLSAGQRQRIGLARALVLEPALLILDETLSALAPDDQQALCELLAGLRRRRRLTTLVISHDLAMVRRLCDRIAVMYLGRIVELGANRPTFFEPLHPYTRALLSALPVLEPNPFPRERFLMDAETPSPIDLPRGCSYAGRCPSAFERCRVDDPVFVTVGLRGGACHLLDADRSPGTPWPIDANGENPAVFHPARNAQAPWPEP